MKDKVGHLPAIAEEVRQDAGEHVVPARERDHPDLRPRLRMSSETLLAPGAIEYD